MTEQAAGGVGAVVGVLLLVGAIRLFWPASDNVPARVRARSWLRRVVTGGLLALAGLAVLYWGSRR